MDASLSTLLVELQSASDALLVTGSDRKVRFLNQRLIELFALPPEVVEAADADAVLERICSSVVSATGVREGARTAAMVAPGLVHVDEHALRDGRVVERSVLQLQRGSSWQRLARFRDVTARRLVERELKARLAQQAAVARLGQLAIQDAPLQGLLDEVVRLVTSTLSVEFCGVLRLDGSSLLLLAGAGWPRDAIGRLRIPREVFVGCLDTPSHRELLPDTGSHPGRVPAPLLALGVRSGLRVAIVGAQGVWGVLAASVRSARAFSFEDLQFLESVANVLAGAIERKRVTEALRSSAGSFRTLIERAPDAMIVHDGAVILYANATAVAWFGHRSSEEMAGCSPFSLFEGNDEPRLREGIRLMQETGRPTEGVELRLRRADGTTRLIEQRAMPLVFEGRRAFLAVGSDLSERRALEARLQLADRMVSVGTLAAGVAHELNNPLAWIMGNLAFASEELEALARADAPDRDARIAEVLQSLREVQTGADRMRGIVGNLKTFSRGGEETLAAVDLNRVLDSSIGIAANEIRQRARLTKALGPVPSVLANEAKLGQVFLNLLVNASQAISEGNVAGNEVHITSGTAANGAAFVEVRDSGQGITAEVKRRIFDPFFTTKPVGLGTGLGLSICHNIVAAFGGEIEVESEVGQGALFRVLLPAAPAPLLTPTSVARLRLPALSPLPRLRTGRVLVVDDEPLVGASIRRALRNLYEVVVLTSAHEALNRLTGGERYLAVLSDLLMPEMSGMELHARVSEFDAGQARRMLFMTGGAFTNEAHSFIARSDIRHLLKPFTRATLCAALDALGPESDPPPPTAQPAKQ